ncbi:glycosyltransferase family 4 protein [Flavivirga algicola]|uniref:Glycosyltransferase family 4 protein n=1 Tax=Flavivirga algicola TaxID=2729136 RepID=A0ABX1RV61_9FLAO|nr:glycosyltransferase family 4 protein [Flavivirga algicola]NMH86668.1 glycosyltransferase family 4 protein [Flavivirga algicola]
MNKRLLFITPMFPKDKAEDTIVPFITHFTETFVNNTDAEVDILALMFPLSKDYFYEGIKVYTIKSGYKKKLKMFPYLIKAISRGIYLDKKNNYDGILCFWYSQSTLVGKVISKFTRTPQIVWMLGQDVKKNNKYLNWIKIPAHKIIMVSNQQRNIFYKNYKIYVKKIANVAINPKRFPKINNEERKIQILGVGNLSPLKNYSLFIDIIQVLKKEFSNISVVLCGGDGEDKNSLLKKVDDFDLSNNIKFTGTIPHKKVLNFMNNSTIFLHTSKFEGNPTVVQEALYSGCYVISTIPMEQSSKMDTFFHSTEKDEIINKIKNILHNQKFLAKRVEKFKMTDTIDTVYKAFFD